VRNAIEASLRRLDVRRSTTQLHAFQPQSAPGRNFWWLRKCQKRARSRVSVRASNLDEALLCREQPDLASLQIIFNLFRQKPIDSLSSRQGEGSCHHRQGASGQRLTVGKINKDTKFAPGSSLYNHGRTAV
jgi:hypothetical protein